MSPEPVEVGTGGRELEAEEHATHTREPLPHRAHCLLSKYTTSQF